MRWDRAETVLSHDDHVSFTKLRSRSDGRVTVLGCDPERHFNRRPAFAAAYFVSLWTQYGTGPRYGPWETEAGKNAAHHLTRILPLF